MKFRYQVPCVLPVVMLAYSLLTAPAAQAQFSQQGPKLVGTDTIGVAAQGFSVSLSGEGNTAILSGPYDNGDVGAAWVYARSRGVWRQQAKLVGTGAIGKAGQGWSVSLSDDGNTAIVGGYFDNNLTGAAWVYTRSGRVWRQQAKLVGTGAVGTSGSPVEQGSSVALSADGSTAIVGGPGDDNVVGAAWVYTRSGGVWTQQGTKLVGTGAVGRALQGVSASLSGDGNTAIVGGENDSNGAGAAWIFTEQPVFAGTPGRANCDGKSVAALAQQFGGLNAAAAALGYSDVNTLQNAILTFCGG